jgi:hypothetical protein
MYLSVVASAAVADEVGEEDDDDAEDWEESK